MFTEEERIDVNIDMGCTSSQPQEPAYPNVTKPSSTSKSTATKSVAAVGSATARSKPQTPAKPISYETALSASLSESGGTNVPFHGILTDAGNLNLSSSARNDSNKLKRCGELANTDDDVNADTNLLLIHGVAMTMPYRIIIPSSAGYSLDTIRETLDKVFHIANIKFNGWNETSEISKFNKLAPEKKHPISIELTHLFDIVDDVYQLSDGRYDPTIGGLSLAFENCIRDNQRPLQPSETARLKYAVGWTRKVKRIAGGQAMRMNANTIVDLDGVSKGHVVDLIVEALQQKHAIKDAYVDWAGDIAVIGQHPTLSRPWQSGLIKPPELKRVFKHWKNGTMNQLLDGGNDDGPIISHIASYATSTGKPCAIATSGDYFSVFKFGFHHIAHVPSLSLLKASPLSVASVAVVAEQCAIADAIATAAMTYPTVKEAADFLSGLCQRSDSTKVLGFCVLNRSEDSQQEHRWHIYSEQFFKPNETALEVDSHAPATQKTDLETSNVPAQVEKLEESHIFKWPVLIRYEDREISVDSFTSYSMNPEPLVTFCVPASFTPDIVNNTHINGINDTILYCTIIKNGESTVTATVRLHSIIKQPENMVLLFAAIVDVDFGTMTEFKITHTPNNVGKVCQVDMGEVARSKFRFCDINEKARTLHRHTPAMVWVLSLEAADGTVFAVTATSLFVIQSTFITLNIAHSSTFYAEFSGPSSIITAYALSSSLQHLAQKFVSHPRPSQTDLDNLDECALARFQCSVSTVSNMEDHASITAVIIEASTGKTLKDYDSGADRLPLTWLGGQFVKWTLTTS